MAWVAWWNTEVVCPSEDGHPSQYLSRRPGIEPATVESRAQRHNQYRLPITAMIYASTIIVLRSDVLKQTHKKCLAAIAWHITVYDPAFFVFVFFHQYRR